jgi:hypothetical protein
VGLYAFINEQLQCLSMKKGTKKPPGAIPGGWRDFGLHP